MVQRSWRAWMYLSTVKQGEVASYTLMQPPPWKPAAGFGGKGGRAGSSEAERDSWLGRVPSWATACRPDEEAEIISGFHVPITLLDYGSHMKGLACCGVAPEAGALPVPYPLRSPPTLLPKAAHRRRCPRSVRIGRCRCGSACSPPSGPTSWAGGGGLPGGPVWQGRSRGLRTRPPASAARAQG